MHNQRTHTRIGLAMGLGAYCTWGLFPLYFNALAHIDPIGIVTHRIIWSLVLLVALVSLLQKWPAIRNITVQPRLLATIAVTALLISGNWLLYVWAVVHKHVLAASLGYYLTPLANVLLGVILLQERLTRPQTVAITLAAFGVAVLAFNTGGGLWISLMLAASFALYGFVRKITPVEALEGLLIETAILAPFAMLWLLWMTAHGQSGFDIDMRTTILLLAAGLVTAIPLLFFNAAAKRLPYSTLGFLQYVSPSLQFLLAIFVFDEKLSLAQGICFATIWTALVIFALDGLHRGRTASRVRIEAVLE